MDLWTTQQSAILIKLSEDRRFVVVNHYTDILNLSGGDQTLSRLMASIKEQYPGTVIILGGDMNRCPEMTDELASKLNLIRADTEPGTYTRRQKSSPDAILDYFLSSKKLKQETMFNMNLKLSDHLLIKCVIKFESNDDNFHSNISH